MDRKELIRTIYLYLFSFIGLVLIVIGVVRIVDLGLKMYVFKNADQVLLYPEPKVVAPMQEGQTIKELTPEAQAKNKQDQVEYQTKQQEAERERTAANALAMIIVGTPLFAYHWKIIQKKS